MLLKYLQRLGSSVNREQLIPHKADAVDHEWNAGYMIKMGMRNENVIDHAQLGHAKIAHTRARINQHIVIQQHRSGAKVSTYAAAATKYSKFNHLDLII